MACWSTVGSSIIHPYFRKFTLGHPISCGAIYKLGDLNESSKIALVGAAVALTRCQERQFPSPSHRLLLMLALKAYIDDSDMNSPPVSVSPRPSVCGGAAIERGFERVA